MTAQATPREDGANAEAGPAAEASRRRTFAVISHPDAGTSTLTEALALHGRQGVGTRAGHLHHLRGPAPLRPQPGPQFLSPGKDHPPDASRYDTLRSIWAHPPDVPVEIQSRRRVPLI